MSGLGQGSWELSLTYLGSPWKLRPTQVGKENTRHESRSTTKYYKSGDDGSLTLRGVTTVQTVSIRQVHTHFWQIQSESGNFLKIGLGQRYIKSCSRYYKEGLGYWSCTLKQYLAFQITELDIDTDQVPKFA